MGKGSSKQQQEVNDYRMSLHYGICSGPVALREIKIDDKTVWTGRMADAGPIYINDPTLFGGPTKEGGVSGVAYFLPGKPDQVLPTGLAQRFGLTATTCPAFRGVASIFFVGSVEQPGGFLWSSNTPFIRPVKVKVERAPIGLDPTAAMLQSSVIATFSDLTAFADGFVTHLSNGIAGLVGPHIVKISVTPGPDFIRTLTIDGTTIIQQPFIADDNNNHSPGYTITYNGEGEKTLPTSGGTLNFADAKIVVAGSGDLTLTVGGDSNRNANAIHMIYECLTNTDWGMAAPEYLIDRANFELAAQKIYNEQFMLSIFWTQQDTVEKYVSEILDHILATFFVNPRTGLLSVLLLRDDYDFASLPEINPANARMKSFKRKLYGETTNEINVSWTNPATEKSETITYQDLANIEIQGAPVSDSRNYYGIRSAVLASQVAARDSASASAPLAAFDVELDRTMWDLLPGQVVRVNWPRYRLNNTVCRVMKIAYGKAGTPKITVSLMEDIFSISKPAIVTPPSSAWAGVAEDPAAMQFAQVFTLPYFLAVKETSTDHDYPAVLAGVLAYQPGGATTSYDLYTQRLQANGALDWQSVGAKTIVGRSTMLTPLFAETTTQIYGLPLTGEARGPQVNGLVVIGDGTDAATEIALLAAYNSDTNTWTVNRGVLDTVPRAWPIDTPVWFVPQTSTIGDTLEVRSVGESPQYKLVSRTSRGVLPLENAPVVTGAMTARPHAPLRPANFKVNGIGFGNVDATGAASLELTWSTRNRLTEDTLVVGWDTAAVSPEYLQMTVVTIFRENGQPMITWRGLYTENSLSVPIAYVQEEQNVFVRVTSERSGIASIQGHGLWVRNIPQIANPAPPPTPAEPGPPPPPAVDPDPTPDPVEGPNATYSPGYGFPGEWR